MKSEINRHTRASFSSFRRIPVQNAYIESFYSRLRDEFLNEHAFLNLAEGREIIASWRHDYNCVRPPSSLERLTPIEFVAQQGDGPPEQAQRSAARPLRHRPTRGTTSIRTLPIIAGKFGCRPKWQ